MDVEKAGNEHKQEFGYDLHTLDSPASDVKNEFEYSKEKSNNVLCGNVYDISSSSLIKSPLVSELLTSHGVLKNGFLEDGPLCNSYCEYGSTDDNLSPSSFLGVYSIQSLANWNALEDDDDDRGEYKCGWDLCDMTFNYRKELAHHVNNLHINQDENSLYRCLWNGCARHGKSISARYRMLIHMRTHTHEKPHACDVCGKKFSRLENLRIHNRSHTGEKPYVCPVEGCGKAYSNSSDRFKHSKTHQEDKPYVCRVEGCDKRYTDPSSLRKHMKSSAHGGENCQKPTMPGQLSSDHTESINGEKQNSEPLLKIPKLSDTLLKSTQSKVYDGYRPYACREEGCGKRYTDPGSLRKHQRTTSHGRSGNALKGKFSPGKQPKVYPIKKEEDATDVRSSSPESPSSSTMEFTKEKTDISPTIRTDEISSEMPSVVDADLTPLDLSVGYCTSEVKEILLGANTS